MQIQNACVCKSEQFPERVQKAFVATVEDLWGTAYESNRKNWGMFGRYLKVSKTFEVGMSKDLQSIKVKLVSAARH